MADNKLRAFEARMRHVALWVCVVMPETRESHSVVHLGWRVQHTDRGVRATPRCVGFSKDAIDACAVWLDSHEAINCPWCKMRVNGASVSTLRFWRRYQCQLGE